MTDPEYIYHGTVTETGEIKLPGKKMRRELAAGLSGKRIRVVVSQERKRTSSKQGRYYWGCIVQAFLSAFQDWDPETGWTDEKVHKELKGRYLPLVREWGQMVVPTTGEVVKEPMTTTKLDTAQREAYHAYCRKWAEEMDILIALPNEQVEMFENETI